MCRDFKLLYNTGKNCAPLIEVFILIRDVAVILKEGTVVKFHANEENLLKKSNGIRFRNTTLYFYKPGI